MGNKESKLFKLVHSGSSKNIRRFLEKNKGLNLDIRDDLGQTPLIYTVNHDIKVGLTLLYFGANPNFPNARGSTPLMRSVLFKKKVLLQALIDAGAKLNLKDSLGNTALTYAAKYNPDVIQTLVEAGANQNNISLSLQIAKAYGKHKSYSILKQYQKKSDIKVIVIKIDDYSSYESEHPMEIIF